MTLLQTWRNLGSQLPSLRQSKTTRAGLLNGICGIADYLAQPLGMLLAAPFLIHRMGLPEYGLWMLASAAIGSGGLLSTGFSDMAVKYVAMYRGRGDWLGVTRVIQGSITINLVLGTLVSILLWFAAPFAGEHIFKIQPSLQLAFVQSIRLGCAILLVRSLDSIFVSVLRAFEKYRPAVQITVAARALNILGAVVLVAFGRGVVSIMAATLTVNTAAMILQALAVRSHVGRVSFLPAWDDELLPKISLFGCFSWLQALSGIVFGQADRLIVGALLGTSALAYYSVCTQAALPIHGLVASGLHFLFPHLSARHSVAPVQELKPVVTIAFWLNLVLVVSLCLPLALFSRSILTAWMGPAFAAQTSGVLSVVAIGFALVGINVTGHYTLMAVGAVRYVTFVNLAAGLLSVAFIALLIPRFGLMGAAMGRLVYGPVTWFMYYKIHRLLRPSHDNAAAPALSVLSEEA